MMVTGRQLDWNCFLYASLAYTLANTLQFCGILPDRTLKRISRERRTGRAKQDLMCHSTKFILIVPLVMLFLLSVRIFLIMRCWLAKTENTSRILEIRELSRSNCWLHWMPFSSLPNFVESSSGVRAWLLFTGTLGNWNKVTRRRKCLFSNTFEPTRDH